MLSVINRSINETTRKSSRNDDPSNFIARIVHSNHFRETFDRSAITVMCDIIEIGRNYFESVPFRGGREVRACLICTFTSVMDERGALGVGYVIFETISFVYCV